MHEECTFYNQQNQMYFIESFSISKCWSLMMLRTRTSWGEKSLFVFCFLSCFSNIWLPRRLYVVSWNIFWQSSLSWEDKLLFQVSILRYRVVQLQYQTDWETLSTLTNSNLSVFVEHYPWLLHFQDSNLTLMI